MADHHAWSGQDLEKRESSDVFSFSKAGQAHTGNTTRKYNPYTTPLLLAVVKSIRLSMQIIVGITFCDSNNV